MTYSSTSFCKHAWDFSYIQNDKHSFLYLHFIELSRKASKILLSRNIVQKVIFVYFESSSGSVPCSLIASSISWHISGAFRKGCDQGGGQGHRGGDPPADGGRGQRVDRHERPCQGDTRPILGAEYCSRGRFTLQHVNTSLWMCSIWIVQIINV